MAIPLVDIEVKSRLSVVVIRKLHSCVSLFFFFLAFWLHQGVPRVRWLASAVARPFTLSSRPEFRWEYSGIASHKRVRKQMRSLYIS